MKRNTDPDSGEAPDAADTPERPRPVRSLPAPRAPRSPPALGGPSPTVEEVREREPEAELSLSPGHVYVTVELPGAVKESIEVEATDRTLTVRAPRVRAPIYRLLMDLPARVEPESAKATFRNGILDVTLRRSGGEPTGR